jgi:predicted MPP superfamily phosphohydrolase
MASRPVVLQNPPVPRFRRRIRFVFVVLLVAIGMQVPLIAALARLTGRLGPVLGLAGLLTVGFAAGLTGPRTVWGEPRRARLYLVIWPFFTWWTLSLLFAVLAPLAFAARAVFHLSLEQTLAADLVAAALGTALALRQRPRVREHEIAIADLPAAFDGYRVAHISDLHCGPFVSGARVASWVTHVNRLGADLIAVTGDLIASGSAYVAAVANALGELRAPDGVFACMGNHDYFTDSEALVRALEGGGVSVLRNRGVTFRRADAQLHVAGVDDTWTGRHDLERALAGRPEGAPVVLLAHDPALFPGAAEREVDLTLSGHTHGGQVAIPFLARRFNLARFLTPFTAGPYTEGASTLYVNRGLGTTGPPVRLAVPPEIAVLTLRRAPVAAPSGGGSAPR